MHAEIIAAGTEILLGQIVDTNTSWISRELASLGIDLYYHSSVGDNQKRLEEVLKIALDRSSLILITGGLGPTTDDLTREVVASVMDTPLLLHEDSLKRIEERYRSMGKEMAENNRRQAYLPKGSIPIENNWGTAPGFILEKDHRVCITLPGVPKEMKYMMKETILPYLEKRVSSGASLYSKVLMVYGVGESNLDILLSDLIKTQTNPTIALLASRYQVKIRLTMKACHEKEAEKAFDLLEKTIRERLGDSLYSSNGETMEEVVKRLLMEKEKTLSLAESITGGLVSHQITNSPGASHVLKGSWVPYTYDTKSLLGISKKELKDGTVSPIVSLALARRVREMSGSSIGAAVTGLAGPEGERDKPIGLVYTALSFEDGEEVKRAMFHGDRREIKERAALSLLNRLRLLLLTM